MSRSFKRSPAGGIARANSDKLDKVTAHRQQRATIRNALASGQEPVTRKKAGNAWKFSKDGHRWYGWAEAARHPELLRK